MQLAANVLQYQLESLMKGLLMRESSREHHVGASSGADLYAEVIGYARGEFRDGRRPDEVVRLLLKRGYPKSIRGIVREVYFDTLGVSDSDRAIDFLLQILSVPLFYGVWFKLPEAWWSIPAVTGMLAAYLIAEHWAIHRYWERRSRRRNA